MRWNPDRSPYAVELRFDLVARISGELAQAERLGIEIGGMLLGSLPEGDSPILRVDEIAMISRRFEDGAIYVLDPGKKQQLNEILASAWERGRVAVGFFRSHLRPGPLQPSLADRTLLTDQFKDGVYTLLLIQSREPRTAAFFLAANGALPDQPSAKKFFFDDAEFQFLPEVQGEELDGRAVRRRPVAASSEQRYPWFAALILVLLAGFLLLGAFSGGISRWLLPPLNKLDLSVVASGDVLKISWDHSAPFVARANGATITIRDGSSQRNIHLGPDELKLGEVDYEHVTKTVGISVALDSPGTTLPPQTFDWIAP